LVLLALGWAEPAASKDADPIEGVWKTQIHFGPMLRGELIVGRADGQWNAALAGKTTRFTPNGSSMRFDFGGHGAFRGQILGRQIRGFWLQPSSRKRPN
jgi:hypothetical protein